MAPKSKLKLALLADKGVDLKKQKFLKQAKQATKKNEMKKGKGGDKEEGDWEDVDDEEKKVNGDADEEEESADEEEVQQMNISAIDESDSSDGDDLQGENELSEEEEDDEDDDEDDEDIPISDLEDLSDTEKEDLIPHQRLTINNTTALTSALKRISLPLSSLPFSAHQSLTSSEPIKIADVSDDLNRELAFYAQSLEAVKEGRKLLKQEGVPFTRPTDYFAEMVKADEHMEKVKRKLVEEAASKKASAEARKQRDLKKFGKQVQVAKLQEREKEKRETLEKIKSLKRKRGTTDITSTNEPDLFDVALDSDDDPSVKKGKPKSAGKADGGRNPKRAKKDAKFGHGGKKRFSKSGDAMSSADMSGFDAKAMKGRGGGGARGGRGGKRGGAAKRPGKARRHAAA